MSKYFDNKLKEQELDLLHNSNKQIKSNIIMFFRKYWYGNRGKDENYREFEGINSFGVREGSDLLYLQKEICK
jgi:hypothetical protein